MDVVIEEVGLLERWEGLAWSNPHRKMSAHSVLRREEKVQLKVR